MKRLFIFCISFALISTLKADEAHKEKDTQWLKDQGDQTDTLAVPLDSSEAEEEAEEQELQNKKKKQVEENKEIRPSIK